jgi:hypothetical protein
MHHLVALRMMTVTVLLVGIITAGCSTGQDVRSSPSVLYHSIDGRQVDMTPVVTKNLQDVGRRFDLVLPGRRATYRVNDPRPIFLCDQAGDVILVRLRPGDEHDDRNLKIGLQVGKGVYIPVEEIVDLVVDVESSGLFRLMPRRPLESGEYGFVSASGVFRLPATIFDFGVD